MVREVPDRTGVLKIPVILLNLLYNWNFENEGSPRDESAGMPTAADLGYF